MLFCVHICTCGSANWTPYRDPFDPFMSYITSRIINNASVDSAKQGFCKLTYFFSFGIQPIYQRPIRILLIVVLLGMGWKMYGWLNIPKLYYSYQFIIHNLHTPKINNFRCRLVFYTEPIATCREVFQQCSNFSLKCKDFFVLKFA